MNRTFCFLAALAFAGFLSLFPAPAQTTLGGAPPLSIKSPDGNYLAALDWSGRTQFTILQIIRSAKNDSSATPGASDLVKFLAFGIGPRFAVHGVWSSDSRYFVITVTFVDTHQVRMSHATQSSIIDLDRKISSLPKRALLQKGDGSAAAPDDLK
jgi:hypothetical protein